MILIFRQFAALVLLSTGLWAVSTPQYPYIFQPGTPAAIQNFLYPDSGCDWDGVGGQVFDRNGQPAPGLVVRIYGLYGGTPLYANVLTGISLKLGPGGYEYKLGSSPVSSTGQLTMQVFSLSGEALSYPIEVSTIGACDGNLLVVNFFEATSTYDLLFPVINK